MNEMLSENFCYRFSQEIYQLDAQNAFNIRG